MRFFQDLGVKGLGGHFQLGEEEQRLPVRLQD